MPTVAQFTAAMLVRGKLTK